MKISTIIFDVNETLLNLDPLKQSINAALENEQAAEVWFSQLLHYSLVESITNTYHDFSEIAAAVFKMNAAKQNKHFTNEEIKKVLSPINRLRAYPEVSGGLRALQEAGFKLVAFSNGKPEVLKEQLKFAHIDRYFKHILSVDSVKKYKPHPDSYSYAMEQAGTTSEETLMVAAHGWDVAGAMRAGLKAAFIERPGKFKYPLAAVPTISTSNIETLAKLLLNNMG